jgi:hypothetical protein
MKKRGSTLKVDDRSRLFAMIRCEVYTSIGKSSGKDWSTTSLKVDDKEYVMKRHCRNSKECPVEEIHSLM